jgi:hypothetical protein
LPFEFRRGRRARGDGEGEGEQRGGGAHGEEGGERRDAAAAGRGRHRAAVAGRRRDGPAGKVAPARCGSSGIRRRTRKNTGREACMRVSGDCWAMPQLQGLLHCRDARRCCRISFPLPGGLPVAERKFLEPRRFWEPRSEATGTRADMRGFPVCCVHANEVISLAGGWSGLPGLGGHRRTVEAQRRPPREADAYDC